MSETQRDPEEKPPSNDEGDVAADAEADRDAGVDREAERDLPDDADVEADDEEGGEPVATPLPGFGGNDPIFGAFSPVQPTHDTAPPRGMTVDLDPEAVVLDVQGKGMSLGWLFFAAFLLPGMVGVGLLAEWLYYRYADVLPWAGPWTFALTAGAVMLAAFLAVVLRSARSVYERGRARFTEEGVLSEGPQTDWVPREDLKGYRADASTYVLIECEGGQVGVPTPDASSRERVVALLDRWGLPRLD